MSGEQDWIPIESNPDVMNRYLSDIGVPKEWAIRDVFGLDDDLLQFIDGPVLSLVVTFPTAAMKPKPEIDSEVIDEKEKSVYFMRQKVGGACGTIALIHSLANCNQIQLKDDSILKRFIDSTRELSPEEKGNQLVANHEMRRAHHVFAKEGQTIPPPDDNCGNHFVSLVQSNGILYELCGENPCPISHGSTTDDTFLFDAAKVCREYVARDPDNHNFTVVALSRQNNN